MLIVGLVALASLAPNTEPYDVATRRPVPVKKVIRTAGRTPYRVPMPTTVIPRFGEIVDPDNGAYGPTAGYTNPATGEIFLSEYDDFNYAHELFHLLDTQAVTDADRARWQKILKLKGPWNQGTGTQGGFSSPSEIVADYYAAAALGMDLNHELVGSYAQLTPKRLRRMGRSFERMLARRPDLQAYANPVAKGARRK